MWTQFGYQWAGDEVDYASDSGLECETCTAEGFGQEDGVRSKNRSTMRAPDRLE